jgi:endoglucanase
MKSFLLFFNFVSMYVAVFAQAPSMPFPTHYPVTIGTIKPTNQTQVQMDLEVQNFYDGWKLTYLKPGCTAGQYYVEYTNGANICVSEGQGYGMVIVAHMAGYDANAQVEFDGLYRWYKAHPSNINPILMNWRQGANCLSTGNDAATDGDLYIAYGLLLAHRQWGSTGAINYLNEATILINAIKASEMNAVSTTISLGDWATDATYGDDTRPSDFNYDQFTSFYAFTNDQTWNTLRTNCYTLVEGIQTNFSPATGLLPDFIEDVDGSPQPAAPYFLEGPSDGFYNYNACRTPWHLGKAFMINGDPQAKIAADKMNAWIRSSTSNTVANIKSGFQLNGTDIPGNNYQDISFIAPFGVSACVNSINQSWLNNLWSYIVADQLVDNDYYGNTIKMLCMLSISQNYFPPQIITPANAAIPDLDLNSMFSVYPNPCKEGVTFNFKQETKSSGTIAFFDLTGKLLYTQDFESNLLLIDVVLPKLLTGLYEYRIENDEISMFGKIVIE